MYICKSCMYVCMYVCMHARMHACTYYIQGMYVYTHQCSLYVYFCCMYVCMYIHIYTYRCVIYIYIYIYRDSQICTHIGCACIHVHLWLNAFAGIRLHLKRRPLAPAGLPSPSAFGPAAAGGEWRGRGSRYINGI